MSDDSQIRSLANAAFRFVVEVDGSSQAAFTDCTLPGIDWEIEEVKEGGLNTFVHQLPARRKAVKMTLKNGVGNSDIVRWYLDCMSETYERKSIAVKLLDMSLQPIITWNIDEALPIRWSGPELKSDGNTIAIQTLEFICGEISVTLG